MLKNPRPADWLSVFIKRFIYSQLAVGDGIMTVFGRHKPTLTFSILGDPSSIYLNFEVREDQLAAFESYINLAPDLKLAPIGVLGGEAPSYWLTLNIYEVSGLVNGPRAEWSSYIADSEGKPRYVVLEAQAAKGSMDPVNLVTRAGKVSHARNGDRLTSEVYALDGNTFTCDLQLADDHPAARPAAEWIAANDYIYWRNGVCDRAWYNSGMFHATVRRLPDEAVTIVDNTHWAQFVHPRPRHVLQYTEELDLMVSPWYNV